MRCFLTAVTLVCGLAWAQPVLVNPGFEQGTDQPQGWQKVLHGEGFILRRDVTGGREGSACAYLEGQADHGDRACFLQTSTAFPPSRGLRLRFWYRGEGQATGILRVRSAPGAEVPGGEYGTSSFTCPLPKAEWTEFVFEMGVPAAAQAAASIRAEVILYQRGAGVLRYDDVSVETLDDYRPPTVAVSTPGVCPRRPENGRTVLQNPPDFWWPPQPNKVSYTLQLAPSAEFAPAETTTVEGLLYNVYSHAATLKPGPWFWRVRFVDAMGAAAEWSETWQFTVPDDAVPFPVPPAAYLLGKIPASHPRVYATAASLAAFRAPLQSTRQAWWQSFAKRLDGNLAEAVTREPGEEFANYTAGGLTDDKVKLGNRLRSLCGRATSRMQNLAFGYLLTGDERYATDAIEQAVEMAGWNPEGVTSYRNHDQVFRDIAWRLATTYDWCHERMTEEQRATVRAAVLARGRVLFADFASGRAIYEYPYDSHGITAYGFLGICAIALAHDEPEADTWFSFIVATYPALFPPWGGEEGGWAQGCAYWKWSQPFAWWFYDALKSATGLDLYQKAFSRNDGWFKLYMHPPWSDRHHFGDGNHGPPDTTDASNLARFAAVYRNPYFQWYADQITWQTSDLFSYWWYADDLPARPPADLPPGRYFPDIGWVAMHSDLSDPDEVFLAFKSSPYGSFNHSHADQNSFVLYAYGEPLLIDSGYYDWYGSPHDKGWTRQTKAHNAILVNGQGQPIFDFTAKGRILQHFTCPVGDVAVGDATASYKGLLKQARRTIFYLRPRLFIIVDDLEAPEPATFTWALHAEQEMELRQEKGEIVVQRGDARCLVKFLEPNGLTLAQTDQFDPPPTTPRPNEWHATATTVAKAAKQRFITLVIPFRADEEMPQVTKGHGFLRIETEGETDEVSLTDVGSMLLLDATGRRHDVERVFAIQLDNHGGLEPLRLAGGSLAQNGGDRQVWASFDPPTTQTNPVPPETQVSFTLDDQATNVPLQAMRTFDGGVLAWGTVPESLAGGMQVDLQGDATVCPGQRRLVSGEVVWLTSGLPITVRGTQNPLTAKVAFRSLVKDGTPLVAEIVEPAADARRIEAEAFAASGGGSARVYSHRTFLSGGKGLETEVRPGQWVEWRFTSEREERLAVVLKAAVFEEGAQRLLELDGKPVGGTYRVYELPNTGGFGGIPEQWKHLRLAEITVPPGEHVLRLTTVACKANLDYLLLAPVR